ncbi:MAG: hypothetical protein EOO51_12550 [Flavobacterium sp.]|nr:MAG: hypothetical protein EOO51_12550 [Flavobacterium sp.]
MNFLQLYQHYIVKVMFLTKIIFTKPVGVACLLPSMIVAFATPSFSATKFTATQSTLILLLALFILDFITGIAASYIERNNAKKANPGKIIPRLISSEKLQRCGVKASIYGTGTLAVWGVEKVFFIKSFKFETVSEQGFTITMLVVAVFCATEFYSIFFENFKTMGFDIVDAVKKIRGVKKELTEQ